MAEHLYKQAILAKAREATGAGSLPAPDARVVVENPVCGDRIALEISTAHGRIVAIAHDVRGCVLCQAAAAIVGANAPGADRQEAEAVFDDVSAMLKEDGAPPAGRWQDVAMFTPVAAEKSRHHCVLLPFEALRRVLAEATLTE